MTVIAFPGHKLHGGCRAEDRCNICEGGLGLCVVCGGAEGSMPTDCPGRRLTNKEETAILDGRLDYQRREGWINLMAGSGYVMVTTRFRGVAPSGNSFFVDNPPSRGKGRCSVPRSLIHGADDMKLDALDPADGPELTFRLMAWKAEALGFPT